MFDYDPSTEDLSDLDRDYGTEYKPESGGFLPGLEALADGAYEFEVVAEAGNKRTGLDKAANGDRIVNLILRVLPDGATVQHTYWLNRQESVNAFGADAKVLGFDSDTWGRVVPLSKAIPATAARLVGLKFAAHKTSRKGKEGTQYAGKVYHDLRLIRRLGGAPPQQPAAFAPVANGPGAGTPLQAGEGDLPF